MELSMGNNGGASGDEHEAASNSRNQGNKAYHRHSNQQIHQLEKYKTSSTLFSRTLFYVL
jgi:homeobox-leucine zipper protein